MLPRILHVADSLQVGGMERVLVNLVNALAVRGHHQCVCTLRPAGPLAARLHPGVGLAEIGAHGRSWNLPSRLRDIARQFRVDLVHAQNLCTWCDAVRAFAGRIPLMQTFHGFLSASPSLMRTALYRRLASRTGRLTSVCESVRTELARRLAIPAPRIEIIPNGVDPIEFAPRQRGAEEYEIRDRCGGRVLCVTCASLTPAKSPETLIRAARDVPDEVSFAWLGSGPLEEQVRRQVTDAQLQHRFHLLGTRADVRPFLRAADLFALPSNSEAQPMAVLEAMATGLPVVATRVGAIPDMVAEGRAGLLADPGDAAAVAEAIRHLADDPELRHAMGRAVRQRAADEFALDGMVDRYESLYERIADQRPAACPAGCSS